MWMARMGLDHERILVYRIADLQRDLADLQEIGNYVFLSAVLAACSA